MGIFDDYVKSQLNQQEIRTQKKQEMELAELKNAQAEMDLKKRLIPYVIDALGEILDAIKRLGCPSVKYCEEYTTGRILKRTERRTRDAWVFCKQRFSDLMFGVPTIKGYPSTVFVTDDGRFVYPRETQGSWETGRRFNWQIDTTVYGPIVSVDTAAEVIVEEMIESAKDWISAKAHWDGEKTNIIARIEKQRLQWNTPPSKADEGMVKNINEFFSSNDWPALLEAGDYETAVQKYLLFSLTWIQNSGYAKWVQYISSD